MRELSKKIWDNEYSRGGIFLTAGSLMANLLNYAFNALAGRALGPVGYGELSALFSYTYISAVPITVVSTILIQKISASTDGLEKALSIERFFLSKLYSLWPFALVLIMITPFVPHITNLSHVSAYSLLPLTILSFITAYYTAALQALRLFTTLAVMGIIATIIKLLGAIGIFFGVDGILTIIIFLFISTFYLWFAAVRVLHRRKSSASVKLVEVNKRLRDVVLNRQFAVTTASLLAITFLNNADIIYVKKFASGQGAGIYSAWSLFAKMILFATAPAISVAFVFFSSQDTVKRQGRAMILSLFALLGVGIVSFFAYQLCASFFVTLFFGSAYSMVAPHLSKAALFGSFYTAIFYLNNYFLAKKSITSLILPVSIPFYLASLLMTNASLDRVINLNIVFSFIVMVLYVGGYILETKKRLFLR